MRTKKIRNTGNENGDRSGNGLTTQEKLIWGDIKDLVSCQNKEIAEYLFVKHVMKPLLGHKYVNAGVSFPFHDSNTLQESPSCIWDVLKVFDDLGMLQIPLPVEKEFLESVKTIVISQRHSWRANAASVDTNRSFALLMDDLTIFSHGKSTIREFSSFFSLFYLTSIASNS